MASVGRRQRGRVIFTVTVLRPAPPSSSEPAKHRCWGWWPDQDEAVAAFSGAGAEAFFEGGHYHYAVVEAVSPGLLGSIDAPQWWFAADYDRAAKRYEVRAIPGPPSFAARTTGFAMG